MKKLMQNKFLVFTIVGAVIVFSVVAYALLSATATTRAAVLNSDTPAGTTITESMVTEIDVPRDTPGDFYKSADAIIGERLTSNVKTNQLIYPTNIMSSIEVDREGNENFITTSIKVADDNALGGLLTAGDKVDIAVAPNDGDSQNLARALPEFNIDTSLNRGFYYILSNVTILDATTAVSSAQGSNMTAAQSSESGSGSSDYSYYMVSLSYNDYKKLRLAEEFGVLYLNLVPSQNDENTPLIEEMTQPVIGGLVDASVDPFEEQREAAKKEKADDSKKTDESKKQDEENAPANAENQNEEAPAAE